MDMAKLYGRVVERFTRRPVQGAMVRIAGSVAYTDDQGSFNVDAPMGNYQVTIQHPQYRASARNLALNTPSNNIGEIQVDSVIRAL